MRIRHAWIDNRDAVAVVRQCALAGVSRATVYATSTIHLHGNGNSLYNLQMENKLPSVSFVTCTFDSQKTLKECLDSVVHLDYPKELIEVIIVDGGSKDRTLDIIKEYPFCRLVTENTRRPEAATAIGYNEARNELIVNYPSDNVIPGPSWLKRMVAPFLEDTAISAVQTLHYTYNKNDTPLNRYFSLFGMNDPVAYYLGKCDRAPQFKKSWHLHVPAQDKGDYITTTFNQKDLPTVGANGFIIRKSVVQLVTKEPLKFFHIDACYDLVGMAYNRYAFVKTSIWHKTGEEFSKFFKRKARYAGVYFKDKEFRRYHLYNPKNDRLKLLVYILSSLTVVEPLLQSLRGYVKIRDPAWFLHPVVCFMTVFLYFYATVVNRLRIYGLLQE